MDAEPEDPPDDGRPLRRGWTTGACATAAAKAAYRALLTGVFPDPVEIVLPKGERPSFALALEERGDGFARAGIVKDAGDDPDVTHGALIVARVRLLPPGSGVVFKAGEGVGMVTMPGLPIPPGEPAINPAPRAMMRAAIAEVAAEEGASGDVEIEISIRDGAALALRTWNPRLGIVGGLSVLGTTGVVVPYSCSAWIHSIHRGVDVARAVGYAHIGAAVGATSEGALKRLYGLPDTALIDMGDFAGGLLKYLRAHPVPKLSIAGGFAKMSKLAAGSMDLHSGRSQVDLSGLAELAAERGATAELVAQIAAAPTGLQALRLGGAIGLGDAVAAKARAAAIEALRGAEVAIEVIAVDRNGAIVGRAN
ncbi:cobalt-precorrin-5B (C(1))-methyltransferase [Hansschlegelia plantiphila]|uniref:Cobalt-precorrin-5B C(1)-methyltransferase n=1 Tax=Hansschlegelia plantiphila TaxID=374655 RepID=A0A9W6MUL6_9HYPH|nr:cobalt-precorrin-5B (C(1))-methyltransferase [Hansschlegelia plantiphila]GLK67524.1 cobalt-precorrin-5B C(1)-methyltransferase [Hansschlegelia plantiphila]